MSIITKAALLLAFTAAFASCKKDDDEGPAPATPPDPIAVSAFSNLAVGNYWVYERRQVDSLDVDQGVAVRRDSLYVAENAVMGTDTFTILRLGIDGQPGTVRYYWRDSADCILNQLGKIVFRSTNFGQVYYSDLGAAMGGLVIDYSATSTTVPVSVPAGNFNAYMVVGNCISSGGFPVVPAWKFPREYWSEGVGRVKWSEFYLNGLLGYRNELVNYHVQ